MREIRKREIRLEPIEIRLFSLVFFTPIMLVMMAGAVLTGLYLVLLAQNPTSTDSARPPALPDGPNKVGSASGSISQD